MYFRFCVLVFGLHIASGLERSGRFKRGAAGYPVFGGGSAGHGGQPLTDPTPFINYLGGGGGGSNHYSNLQARPRSGYDGTGGGALDFSNLNGFAQSRHSRSGGSSSSSSSGWQPSSGYGGGGGYTNKYGYISPGFSSGSPSPMTPSHSVPNLDANSLLYSAKSSFNAQTEVFNALTAGSHYQPYKGGR